MNQNQNHLGGLVLFSFFLIFIYVSFSILGWAIDKEAQFEDARLRPYVEGYNDLLEDDLRRLENDTYLYDNRCY